MTQSRDLPCLPNPLSSDTLATGLLASDTLASVTLASDCGGRCAEAAPAAHQGGRARASSLSRVGSTLNSRLSTIILARLFFPQPCPTSPPALTPRPSACCSFLLFSLAPWGPIDQRDETRPKPDATGLASLRLLPAAMSTAPSPPLARSVGWLV